jgi:hypothetical protein
MNEKPGKTIKVLSFPGRYFYQKQQAAPGC